MKKLLIPTLTLVLFSLSAWVVTAQEQTTQPQQPSAEELEKQKAEREKNAYRLLDQVIDEAQSLRLVENRVRVQINAADMLWDQNQGRARGLFSMAAEGVAEIGRTPVNMPNNRRGFQDGNAFNQGPPAQQAIRNAQLRTELVLTAAKHDAALAYQLLASTKPPANVQPTTADGRNPRVQLFSDDNLEQTLLGRVAALDPKLAAQNAEQMMAKGQFPSTLTEVINQLYKQDPDAADKLADKTVKQIQAANILTKGDATGLVQNLLRPGPRPAGAATASTTSTPSTGRQPVLGQAAYVDLLSTVVDAALKATPNAVVATQPARRGSGVGPGPRPQPTPQPPTEAQIEQSIARRLLNGLQMTLPMIDQYLPSKATMVRQKLTDLGMTNTPMANLAQTFSNLQGDPTSDALYQAAANAPPQMQSRLYQQAAFKAIDEGNTERAREIADHHLQNNARDVVMQRVDFKEMAKKAEGARIEEIRQSVARLQTDNEKIDLLIQVAGETQKTNQKVALQLLEDARQIVNRRATNYEHFEQQLKVAHAFSLIDVSRSFEVLDPAISQLNELLSAAAVLSGFEINMFRDGEMSIQGGNGLTSAVNRFGQELAVLARSDFERSETLAGRFQFAEPRIMTRMSIVQGLLGVRRGSGRVLFGNAGGGDSFVIRQD